MLWQRGCFFGSWCQGDVLISRPLRRRRLSCHPCCCCCCKATSRLAATTISCDFFEIVFFFLLPSFYFLMKLRNHRPRWGRRRGRGTPSEAGRRRSHPTWSKKKNQQWLSIFYMIDWFKGPLSRPSNSLSMKWEKLLMLKRFKTCSSALLKHSLEETRCGNGSFARCGSGTFARCGNGSFEQKLHFDSNANVVYFYWIILFFRKNCRPAKCDWNWTNKTVKSLFKMRFELSQLWKMEQKNSQLWSFLSKNTHFAIW